MSSKDVIIFEQSVDFFAKYYYGKKLSSNIILYKLPNVSNEVTRLIKWLTSRVSFWVYCQMVLGFLQNNSHFLSQLYLNGNIYLIYLSQKDIYIYIYIYIYIKDGNDSVSQFVGASSPYWV